MIKYRVKFERIGRDHNVPDLDVACADGDGLAAKIHSYARKYLRSRDYDVDLDVDLDKGKGSGFISCGMHSGGSFTIEVQP